MQSRLARLSPDPVEAHRGVGSVGTGTGPDRAGLARTGPVTPPLA